MSSENTKPKDGGYAFPCIPEGGYPGMTLRQYYAGLVMQAIMSNSDQMGNCQRAAEETNTDLFEVISNVACGMADALLKELAK